MTQKTSVVRNRITIDDRIYEARAQGGGRFNVVMNDGRAVGTFTIKGGAIEVEELGIEGADPVEQIGALWVKENLSGSFQTRMAMKPSAGTAAATPTAEPSVATAAVPAAADPKPSPPKAPEPKPPPIEAKTGEPRVIAIDPNPPEPRPPSEAKPLAKTPAGAESKGPPKHSVCRIAIHGKPDEAALEKARVYQDWLRTQPGLVTTFISRDPGNGNTMSISIWEDETRLKAMRYVVPPKGAVELPTVRVETRIVVG